MTEQITITHVITATSVATTVTMPGEKQITKTWNRAADNSMIGDFALDWEEEPSIPEEVARAADHCPANACSVLEE